MTNFTCYGCCVSRDIFNVPLAKDFNCQLTISQNPISTMFHNPFSSKLEEFQDDHAFTNRMLFYDANKLTIEKLKEPLSDYIIIDLGSERIRIFVFSMNGKEYWMCKSQPFINTWYKWKKDSKYKGIKKVKDIETLQIGSDYEENIRKFVRQLLEIYPHSKIIYNSVRMADYYNDKGEIKKFNSRGGYKIVFSYNNPDYGNKIIKRAERCFLQELCEKESYCSDKGIHIIPFPAYTMASTTHHFGLHPLHFEEAYYWYAAYALQIIVESRSKSEEINKLEILRNYQGSVNRVKFGNFQ